MDSHDRKFSPLKSQRISPWVKISEIMPSKPCLSLHHANWGNFETEKKVKFAVSRRITGVCIYLIVILLLVPVVANNWFSLFCSLILDFDIRLLFEESTFLAIKDLIAHQSLCKPSSRC